MQHVLLDSQFTSPLAWRGAALRLERLQPARVVAECVVLEELYAGAGLGTGMMWRNWRGILEGRQDTGPRS